MEDLTLVIPVKNESESLPTVLSNLNNFNCKKIIVIDPLDNETFEVTKNFNCKTVMQKNKGYGNALIEGINSVQTSFLCIFNADGSFNSDELISMRNKIISNNYDFIFASRYQENGKSDDDNLITMLGNFFFTKLGKIFFSLPITDILYTFVLGKTESFKKLNLKEQSFGFCVELPIKAKRNDMRLCSVSAHEKIRIAGEKKVNEFRDGFIILLSMLKLFFNIK